MKSGPGPNYEDELPTPDELQEIREYIKQHRTTDAPLEVVLAGETPADDTVKAREIISSYAEVGLTWWIETIEGIDKLRPSIAAMRARIRRGPVAI
jgi:hypothetical protein